MTPRRFASLVALVALGACDGPVPVVGPTGVNRCNSDAQCLDGVCNLTTHRCVSDARTEVFFRVVPPSSRGGSAIATLTAPRTIQPGQPVDLTLRAWRTVYGTVAAPREGDPMGAPMPVPATVIFSPADAPGVVPSVDVVSQTTALAPVGNDATPHTWALPLSDGTFDVVVRPALAFRATVPPRFEPRFDVRAGSPYQRFDIVYPATYARWSGTVLGRDGTPVPGLTVRAIDRTRNGLDVSTTVTTAATTGAWSVAMAPGAPQDWSLRVSADVNAHAGMVFEVKRSACARIDPTGEAVTLRLPTATGLPGGASGCRGCVEVSGTVEGTTTTGLTRPLRGATVTLHTDIPINDATLGSDASAWFEDRVQTDAEGTFHARLIPGRYTVLIEPQDEQFANTVARDFAVRDDVPVQSGRAFVASRRFTVEGRVLTSSGEPVRGARVEAIPFAAAYDEHACLATGDMALLAPRATNAETSTASDGTYGLTVDPGLYRLVVEPQNSAGFAVMLAQTECVSSNVRALDVVLRSPAQVRGVVRDGAGNVVGNATVEAIARVRQGDAPGVSLRVGRVTTASDGSYTMLLPADTTAAASP